MTLPGELRRTSTTATHVENRDVSRTLALSFRKLGASIRELGTNIRALGTSIRAPDATFHEFGASIRRHPLGLTTRCHAVFSTDRTDPRLCVGPAC